MGATMMEWSSGLVMFMIISLFCDSSTTGMPVMLLGLVVTTMTMASIRKAYPDEERGIRNALMSACGICPVDVPPPAFLQPVWSSSPIDELNPNCAFVTLGFGEIFPSVCDLLLVEEAISLEELRGENA